MLHVRTKLVQTNFLYVQIGLKYAHHDSLFCPHSIPDPELDISTSLVGILVMQDMQLGILMAVMPFFMEGEVHSTKSPWSIPPGVLHLVQVMVGFTFLLLTTRGLTTRRLDRFYRYVLCVEWGSTNTSWHIDVHYVKIIHTYILLFDHFCST